MLRKTKKIALKLKTMELVQIYTFITGTNYLVFFSFFLIFSSWIRLRKLNGDADSGGKINADPEPQPWFEVPCPQCCGAGAGLFSRSR